LSPRDDRFPDMPSSAQTDAAIERVLHGAAVGDAVGDDGAPFARFVDDMRVMGDGPPPPPSPELAALLVGSTTGSRARASMPSRRWRIRGSRRARPAQPSSARSCTAAIRLRVAAVPIAGKAAIFFAVATCAAAGAAGGVLPEPATHFLRRAIEVVTPFELPDDAGARPGRGERVDHTETISGDEPGAAGMSPAGTPPATVASDAGVAPDQEGEAGADPRPEASATDGAPNRAETYPEPAISAGPPNATAPAASPPESKGPAGAAPPHAEPAAGPGPNTTHVPPGQPHPGTPDPGGPGGDALLVDPGATRERTGAAAPKGPSAPPGSREEPPSDAAAEATPVSAPSAGASSGVNRIAPHPTRAAWPGAAGVEGKDSPDGTRASPPPR
jgi:hypothetical protein